MSDRRAEIEVLVEKLINYQSRIYRLSPVELAEFVKIKSNLMSRGLRLTDRFLTKPSNEIVDSVEKILYGNEDSVDDKVLQNSKISELTNVDINIIEKDRSAIRSQLFGNSISARVSQQGKLFSVNWNSRMNICKINFPAEWSVNIEQMLLLKTYNDTFEHETAADIKLKTEIKEKANTLHSDPHQDVIAGLMLHCDFPTIKHFINDNYDNSLISDTYQPLLEKGHDLGSILFIDTAVANLNSGTMTPIDIAQCIGPVAIRKRIFNTVREYFGSNII